MPIIEIESNNLDEQARREIAKKLALWFHRQKVPMHHLVTKFRSLQASEVFSGPYGFAQMPQQAPTETRFAFVTCYIGQHREGAFKAALAKHLSVLFSGYASPEYLFIAMRPVNPGDFFRGSESAVACTGERP
jgi:phenylpyruvate tautomerase PptA (4-oxalocrotonate tautomerase family)